MCILQVFNINISTSPLESLHKLQIDVQDTWSEGSRWPGDGQEAVSPASLEPGCRKGTDWAENNLGPSRVECSNSLGSSTSDLTHSPSPVTPPAVRVRAGRAGIPTPRTAESDTTLASWAGETVARRENGTSSRASRAGQRPLTRYLPVTTQSDFDLRAHIETAGHQVLHCVEGGTLLLVGMLGRRYRHCTTTTLLWLLSPARSRPRCPNTSNCSR